MGETNTAATADATAQLDALAADLSQRGFVTNVVAGGRYPRLTVVNRAASLLAESVYAGPAGDGALWFWWSWAERISPITDAATAAQAVARVLSELDPAR